MFQLEVSTYTTKKKADFCHCCFYIFVAVSLYFIVFTEELEEIVFGERFKSIIIISTEAS